MDYRMYSGNVPAGKNVVELIQQHLENQKQVKTDKLVLSFIGFEGTPGTKFTLNNHKDKMMIPSSGSFITPYTGERGMNIFSLVFDERFDGYIYYIV